MAEEIDGSNPLKNQVNAAEKLNQLLTNISNLRGKDSRLNEDLEKSYSSQVKSLEQLATLQGRISEIDQRQLQTVKSLLETQKKLNLEVSANLKMNTTLLEGLNNLAQKQIGSKLVSDMTSVNNKMAESLRNGKSGARALLSGAKEFGKEMGNSVNTTNLVLGGWQKVYSLYQDLDKTTTDFAKNTNMTREEAWKIEEAYAKTSKSSKELGDTAKKWLQANIDINKQLGTGAVLSKAVVKEYSELKNVAKYEDGVMQSLVMSSALNSKSIKQSASDRLSGIKQGQMMFGIEVNQRQVMADISKIAASTRLNYMGQEQALAKASVQAKAMGIEFSKLEGIANSLMDFEGSITKQMEAEVLTGQTLNLERARYYALTNDVSGLMSEMNAQGITAEKFAGMNRIQQEAIAGAMGMQKDEMAAMFIEQKAVAAYGAKDMEAAKQAYLLDVEKNGLAVANKKLGDDALAKQLQQITNEERRELSQEKMANAMHELVSVVKHIDNLFTSIVEKLSAAGDLLTTLARGFMMLTGLKVVQFLMGGGIKNSMSTLSGGIGGLTGQAPPGASPSVGGPSVGGAGSAPSSSPAGPLTKSGKPDMRFAANRPPAGGAPPVPAGGGSIISNISSGMGVGAGIKSAFANGAWKNVLKGSILSSVMTALFGYMDFKSLMENPVDESGNLLNKKELARRAGKIALGSAGGIIGGILGTAVGGPIGSIVGSMGGQWLMGKIADWAPDFGSGFGEMIVPQATLDAAPALAEGGLVTSTGMAKVDAGEVYLGANSLQVLKDLVTETRQQNQYLQALVKKDTHISMDGQAVAGVVARNVITSYGNLLNPSSATYA